ncbi:MAG: glycerophosphodiester phosphodiesterase [Microthrixaceae bacterium]
MNPSRPARFEVLRNSGPIAMAHRGGAGPFPENTLEAFESSAALGYRYLETDVHLTRDGVLVAFHDDRLDRVTDCIGLIAELTWPEVSVARVNGTTPIPTMKELLERFPSHRFNIDPKSDATVRPLAEMLLIDESVERVCIGAFSDERLAAMRKLCGRRLCTSMGPRQIARLVAAARLGSGAAARAAAGYRRGHPIAAGVVQVPVRHQRTEIVTPRFVELCHACELQVHVWTINERSEMIRLLDLGVDGLITDEPAVLRDLLVERGEWTDFEPA